MICKNCNKTLNESQNYCDECGAKILKNRLTPTVLAHQVNEQFISIDNKFLKTFLDLFKKPEIVIVGYINGTRRKYIDVLQYFAIALTFAGVQVFLMTTFFKETIETDMTVMSDFFGQLPEQKNNTMDFDGFNQYQSIIYILSVPFAATATWLAYFVAGKRQFNFTEHLVLNLYYNAQQIITTVVLTVLSLIFGFNFLVASTIITIFGFIYLFYVLKCVFKTKFWFSVLCFLLVGAAYSIVFTIVVILIILVITMTVLTLKYISS